MASVGRGAGGQSGGDNGCAVAAVAAAAVDDSAANSADDKDEAKADDKYSHSCEESQGRGGSMARLEGAAIAPVVCPPSVSWDKGSDGATNHVHMGSLSSIGGGCGSGGGGVMSMTTTGAVGVAVVVAMQPATRSDVAGRHASKKARET